MNLIHTICEALGVEINENFKIIESSDRLYRLNESGLECLSPDDGKWYFAGTAMFYDLLVGNRVVTKIPFEPKEGEIYWCIRFSDKSGIYVTDRPWEETLDVCWFDKLCGNRFRTEKEAKREKYNFFKQLTGKEWEE